MLILFFYYTQKLYFIVCGTVAVYTDEGSEITHLYDGDMFGELEFLQYRETAVSAFCRQLLRII